MPSSSNLDRARASHLLNEAGLDALVLFQPENFHYAIGAPPGVAAMWRRAGGATAIVPADIAAAPIAIVGDRQAPVIRAMAPEADIREHGLWIDTVDVRNIDPADKSSAEWLDAAYRAQNDGRDDFAPRPTTFDRDAAFSLLAEALRETGLARGRIGADLGFLPVADFHSLQSLLPEVAWIDATAIVQRLRAIKSPREIEWLRRAVALSEAGLDRLVADVAAGVSRHALSSSWRAGVAAEIERLGIRDSTGSWDFVAVGSDPWTLDAAVEPGAIIKADVGCLIQGYSSDMARTYSFGPPAAVARDVHAALLEAFEVGIATIQPGVALRDIHATTLHTMRKSGYRGYRRGHFGHGVGASVGSEEWPFIAADSDAIAEPGMVLAYETPFYGDGIGAIMIEDQLLVTDTGIELMSTRPRGLIEL